MKYGLCLLFIGLICVACGESSEATDQPANNKTDSIQYYPLQTYFRLQVNQADSNGHSKILTTQTGNIKKADTLTHESFYQATIPFTSLDILESNKKHLYSESVFMDLTTNSYTFSYTTNVDSLPVKSILILVDTTSSLVKRVFIRTQWSNADSSIIEQMGWMHDSSFYINQSVSYPDKTNKQKRTNVTF